jgi:hypothetical protein
VCVTWLIFELENTSGANYIFILGRSSAATIHGYGSNNGSLFIFPLTFYGCSASHVPIIKPLMANDQAKVLPLPELEWWIAGMVSRWAMVWVTSKKANGLCSSTLSAVVFITMS